MTRGLVGRDWQELNAQVRDRIKEIETHAKDNDDEKAHGAEDDLFEDVLMKIADGCNDPMSLATVALKSKKIKFARWTA